MGTPAKAFIQTFVLGVIAISLISVLRSYWSDMGFVGRSYHDTYKLTAYLHYLTPLWLTLGLPVTLVTSLGAFFWMRDTDHDSAAWRLSSVSFVTGLIATVSMLALPRGSFWGVHGGPRRYSEMLGPPEILSYLPDLRYFAAYFLAVGLGVLLLHGFVRRQNVRQRPINLVFIFFSCVVVGFFSSMLAGFFENFSSNGLWGLWAYLSLLYFIFPALLVLVAQVWLIRKWGSVAF